MDSVTNWATTLTSLLANVAANPTGSGIAIGGVVLVLVVLYFWLKSKYNAWLVDQAKKSSDQKFQNDVGAQLPINQANNVKDNENKTDLENMP